MIFEIIGKYESPNPENPIELSYLETQSVSKSDNLIQCFLVCLQRLPYTQRDTKTIKIVSFKEFREGHIMRIILLIGLGLPIKAWWVAAY